MGKKIQATLTDEAFAILEASATERKRGEFISAVLVAYASLAIDPLEDPECGTLETIAARLGSVEKQLRVIATRVGLPLIGEGAGG